MCTGAFKTDVGVIFRERVNQQPVRFDVAITAASKITPERVILEQLRQLTSVDQ